LHTTRFQARFKLTNSANFSKSRTTIRYLPAGGLGYISRWLEISKRVPTVLSFSSHAFRAKQSSVMPLRWRALLGTSYSNPSRITLHSRWILLALLGSCLAPASAMTPTEISELRQETVGMFYHGFDNYMRVAFPEDEVRSAWNVQQSIANIYF